MPMQIRITQIAKRKSGNLHYIRKRLKNIISLGVSTKYLENFQLTIPDTTSNIGEIFEELIAQIENQIHNVEEGKYSE